MGRWWCTVDRWTLLSLIALMGFGALLMLAASPAAAERIALQSFQPARRQIALLPFAAALLIVFCLATARWIRPLACLGFLPSLIPLLLTLVARPAIYGPTRWHRYDPP